MGNMDTFDDYVAALEKLFVIQNISAWCPAIRSKTAIRSSVKRCFCDPSIPIALLGLSPETLSMQLRTFGFIFECESAVGFLIQKLKINKCK